MRLLDKELIKQLSSGLKTRTEMQKVWPYPELSELNAALHRLWKKDYVYRGTDFYSLTSLGENKYKQLSDLINPEERPERIKKSSRLTLAPGSMTRVYDCCGRLRV